MNERELFEKEHQFCWDLDFDESAGRYLHYASQKNWLIWQAARAPLLADMQIALEALELFNKVNNENEELTLKDGAVIMTALTRLSSYRMKGE